MNSIERYALDGVQYKRYTYMYRHFSMKYEVYHEHKQCHARIKGYEEKTIFSGRTRSEVISNMKKWFRDIVQYDHIASHSEKGYSFDTVLPPLMKDVRSHRVAYHMARPEHHDSIMEKGLIPSHNADDDITHASRELDSMRPSWIPHWVQKEQALYLHPEMGNDFLSFYGGPFHVYAVSLPTEDIWVGSRTIGGWCLFDEEMEEDHEWKQQHIESIHEEYGKEYWKYSCSLSEYIHPTRRIQRKIKRGMLDELLVFQPIPSSNIAWIGTFDEQGTFQETTDGFARFVRDEHRDSYSNILQQLIKVK